MSQTPRRRSAATRRDGFTAVELLVATALSAMLMVSILGLLATMNVHCRELMRQSEAQPWKHLLDQQLQRDLANTRQVTVAENQIVLVGYVGTQGLGHDNTLRAAEVTYQIAIVGRTLCLFRNERPMNTPSNAVTSRQLVATGVARFQFIVPNNTRPDGIYLGPVPMSCRIRFFDKTTTAPLAEVAWCR